MLVDRFGRDLDTLVALGTKIGIAVSGGPDSLALLLLATAARPGRVQAATVDHQLRGGSAAEAQLVANISERIGVPHTTLNAEWHTPPYSNVQARAREERYRLLASWAAVEGLDAIATGHHADDQAETFLMRASRGAGLGGMCCILPVRALAGSGKKVRLVRPLLEWRRTELAAIVEEAGLAPVDDPSNRDERFDRSKARALLRDNPWIDPTRLARVAAHCRDADEALQWVAAREFEGRCVTKGMKVELNPSALPRELRRRLLLTGIERLGGEEPPGPQLMQALAILEAGGVTTLAGLKLEGGPVWRLAPAPPRKH